MAAPTYSDGNVLTAADCNNWFVALAAYKTSDTSRQINGTSADADLTVSVAANAMYDVRAALFYKSNQIDATFKWHWTIPSGSDAGLYYASYNNTTPVVVAECRQWATDLTADAANVGTIYPVDVSGTLSTGGSAGAITLVWGGISTTPVMTLTARSKLVLQRIG